MEIDRTAPVNASARLEIAADPGAVWDLMADIEAWPSWNPDVRSVSIAGSPAAGTVFRWKAGPGTITSTVRELDRPRTIAWTGRTLGIGAVHVWRLEPVSGGTLVVSEESWAGAVVRLLRGPMRRTLEHSLESGLRHLKAEAERRAEA
jgi:uncharacterized protein YndB with AHSA1/START domain